MNEPEVGALVDQATLAERVADRGEATDGRTVSGESRDRVSAGVYPDWVGRHWETFHGALTGDHEGAPFPCHFGADSVANGEPLYAVVPSLTDPDSLLRFRDALLEYLDTYPEREGLTSLVTFFRPPDGEFSEGDYHEAFWHLLNFLHVHDPAPWPEDIPTETDDPHWEFCFGGEPMFPTCRAPFYDERRSRYCPVGLEVTFQPRALFDGITADTDAGQRARERIQDRMRDYDDVCPHADLGDWGVEGDREWPQYLFREDDDESPDECPVTFTREHPKATAGVDARVPGRSSVSPGDD